MLNVYALTKIYVFVIVKPLGARMSLTWGFAPSIAIRFSTSYFDGRNEMD